ncbi:MAG: hypothetical protein CMI55_04160 [Parcubacteria group bacterium]|jgi:RNA polymerase-binding transcription factor DksA|nr:hypothetical protein [Parcubacteria group bacterium]|tara:strand:- start:3323 stop:3724 length:402 start_codon:yes stop_codon:yes gene_type:complete
MTERMSVIVKQGITKMLTSKRQECEQEVIVAREALKDNLKSGKTIRNDDLADCCIQASWVKNQSRLKCLEKCLKKFDEAIGRVYDGTYGICISCQEEIPTERLRAVPFADRCVSCKNEKNSNASFNDRAHAVL